MKGLGCTDLWLRALRFRVKGLGLRVWAKEFRVKGLGVEGWKGFGDLGVSGLQFRV